MSTKAVDYAARADKAREAGKHKQVKRYEEKYNECVDMALISGWGESIAQEGIKEIQTRAKDAADYTI